MINQTTTDMLNFPLTIRHLEVGLTRTVNDAAELVEFLQTQNPHLWSHWREYQDEPELNALLAAAGIMESAP